MTATMAKQYISKILNVGEFADPRDLEDAIFENDGISHRFVFADTIHAANDITLATTKLDGLLDASTTRPLSLVDVLAEICKKLNSIETRLTKMEFAPPNGVEFQAIMSDYDDIKKSLHSGNP